MEAFAKLVLKEAEGIKYLIPSGFLRKVNGVDDLQNMDDLDVLMRVVGAEAGSQRRERQEAVARSILNRSRDSVTGYFSGIKGVVLEPGAFPSITWASLPDEYLERYSRKAKRRILDPRSSYKPWELKQVIDSVGSAYFLGEEAHNAESYGTNVREGLHDRSTTPATGVDPHDAVEYAKKKETEYQFVEEGAWNGFTKHPVPRLLGNKIRITLKNENTTRLRNLIVITSNFGNYDSNWLRIGGELVFDFKADKKPPLAWIITVRTTIGELYVHYTIEANEIYEQA